MQTLVVVLQCQTTLLLAGMVLASGVHNVAAEELLPEGKAPRRAYNDDPESVAHQNLRNRAHASVKTVSRGHYDFADANWMVGEAQGRRKVADSIAMSKF